MTTRKIEDRVILFVLLFHNTENTCSNYCTFNIKKRRTALYLTFTNGKRILGGEILSRYYFREFKFEGFITYVAYVLLYHYTVKKACLI